MSNTTPAPMRTLRAALFLCFLSAAASGEEVRILMDLDDDPGTGCLVDTVDGPFDGAEQILISTVATNSPPEIGTVTDVATSDCDPGSGTFGVPVSFDGGWPVGIDNGEGGRDVVETYFPLVASVVASPTVVRLGVVVTDDFGGEQALLTTDDSPDGDPILLLLPQPPSVLEIPTLGEWTLLLLALLLASASVLLLRRRGTATLGLLVMLLAARVAWAAVSLDGLIGEWSSGDLLGSNGLVLFGLVEGGDVCFRVDVDLVFNQAPTISAIADQTIPEDSTTGALAFTVGDAESPANILAVTATSSNQVLVPDANLTLGGAGANRTITVTPEPDRNGTTDVTLTVSDPGGGTASTTFTVTVTSDNDPPSITAIADQTILEDTTTGPLAFTIGDVESPPGSLVVTAASSDPTVIPDANLVLGGAGANRTITVTPAPDQSGGPVTITVTVMDSDGGSVSEQFTVDVTPVNDPPSFALSGDVSSDEDAGPQTVPNQATAISPGPNEAGQTVTFTVINDNNTLFTSQPAIDATTGTLTYEAVAEASGSALVTVTAMDDGGTANGGLDTSAPQTFTITINSVDDPAVVGSDSYRTVGNTLLEVSGSRIEPLPSIFVTGSVLANDSDPDTALAVVGTQGVTAGAVVNMAADGTFTYVPPPGLHGDGNPATADDGFQYQLAGGELGSVGIDIDGFVWYVDNTANGGTVNTGTGTSVDRFSTLADGFGNSDPTDDADDASAALGDTVYVFFGDGTSTNQDETFSVNNGQQLLGEGVDLVLDVNGTPTTLFTGNPARKPLVRNTTTVAVTAINASGTIAGLDIASTGTNAVNLTVGGGPGGHAWVVRDNAINGSAAANAGIDVGHAGTGTTTLQVLRNTIVGGTAVDVESTAGSLHVALDQNTAIRSTSGAAPAAVSLVANGGALVVTSLDGNRVAGATATAGMVFDGVVFDADPSDSDFTGDEVSGGNTAVGSLADPVPGSAMVLTNVAGDLAFGALDLFTDGFGSVGLDATGTGPLNAGAGTGFELTSTGGTVSSSNGPAVDLDPLTAGLVLASVSSGNSAVHAIRLHDVAGSFTAGGGTLANSAGSAIRVTGTNPGDSTVAVSLAGMTVSHAPGLTPVVFGQNSAGPFGLTASTISKSGGRVLELDDMDGGSAFTGTTVTTTNHHGARIIDSAGVHDLPNLQITTPPPAGVDALVLQNNSGIFNVPRLEVTTNGSRGLFASNGGTLNVTGATNQITTSGHSAVEMSSTTVGASGITFAAITASATGANEGLDLDGVGGGTFGVTGTTTVNGTGAGMSGIDVATSGATFTFASIDVDSVGGVGVALTNNTGAVSLNGGDVTAATGTAFDVNGGTHDVSYAGTINNTAGKALEVTGRATAGRTVSLTGNITHTANAIGIDVSGNSSGATVFSGTSKAIDSGTANAVDLVNNTGHTIAFTGGGLDLDATSGTGFHATGGGTVEVAGPGNTVTTTTGTGIDIASTTIGAANATFERVSVNGAASGIVLNDTGTSGGLHLTGDGSTTGSGGTIQNTTSNGVRLIASDDASLELLNIVASGANGIFGTDVENIVLRGVTLTNNGNAVDEGGIRFADTDPVNPTSNGLVGTALFENVTVDYPAAGSFGEHHVEIFNISGSLDLTVTGSTFRNTNNSTVIGADGFLLEMRSSATAALTVTGSTFGNNFTDALQLLAIDSSSIQARIGMTGAGNGNTFTDNERAVSLSNATNADLFFEVVNNDITGHNGHSVLLVSLSTATASAELKGTVASNRIGTAGVPNSGSASGHGIQLDLRGNVDSHISVDANIIRETNLRGINYDARLGAGDLEAEIIDNDIDDAFDGIEMRTRDGHDLCTIISGNTVTNVTGNDAYHIRETDPTHNVETAEATATAQVTNNNTGTPVTVEAVVGIVAVGTCDLSGTSLP